METLENKKINRRATAVSGSLAYYNLLAGMNLARASIQCATASGRRNQSEAAYLHINKQDEISNP